MANKINAALFLSGFIASIRKVERGLLPGLDKSDMTVAFICASAKEAGVTKLQIVHALRQHELNGRLKIENSLRTTGKVELTPDFAVIIDRVIDQQAEKLAKADAD